MTDALSLGVTRHCRFTKSSATQAVTTSDLRLSSGPSSSVSRYDISRHYSLRPIFVHILFCMAN